MKTQRTMLLRVSPLASTEMVSASRQSPLTNASKNGRTRWIANDFKDRATNAIGDQGVIRGEGGGKGGRWRVEEGRWRRKGRKEGG